MSTGTSPTNTTDRNVISVKVYNLHVDTSSTDLGAFFEKNGYILQDSYVPRDSATQKNKGFGFVRFSNCKDAADAIMAMEGQILHGKEIKLAFANDRPPRNSEKECPMRVIQQQEPQIKKLEEIIRLNALEKSNLISKLEKLEQNTYTIERKFEEQSKELEAVKQARLREKRDFENELSIARQRNKELMEQINNLKQGVNKHKEDKNHENNADSVTPLETLSKERPLSIYDGAGEIAVAPSISNTNVVSSRSTASIRKSLSKTNTGELALSKILKQNETILNRISKLETSVFRSTNILEENIKRNFETTFQKTRKEIFDRQDESYKGLEKNFQQQLIDIQIAIHKMKSDGLDSDVKRNGKCADDLNRAMKEMLVHKEKLAARIYTLEEFKAKMGRKRDAQQNTSSNSNNISNGRLSG